MQSNKYQTQPDCVIRCVSNTTLKAKKGFKIPSNLEKA